MNTFTFDGINSGQFNIYCSNGGTYDAAERDITFLSVPGRNGDLTVDNGRYKNTPVKFPCFVSKQFAQNAAQIRDWLVGAQGYRRLEDDAHPDEFRLARYVGGVNFSPRYTDKEAELEIKFSCKPQRFLKSGESAHSYSTSTGSIAANPTPHNAKPLIIVYGSGAGSVTIAGATIKINDIKSAITIDCETQNAYSGATNRNGDIVASTFPELPSGSAAYSFSGGVTRIEIIPRWWTV